MEAGVEVYRESPHGADVAALLQVIALLGVEVRPAMPPAGSDDAYVVLDMGARGSMYDEESAPREVWHAARAEFSRAFTAVGLVLDAQADPPPGAVPVPALRCMPALCVLSGRRPRRISAQALREQLMEAKKAQTRSVLHFLENSIRPQRPVKGEVLDALERTTRGLTHPALVEGLHRLRAEINRSSPEGLRDVLVGYKNLLEG